MRKRDLALVFGVLLLAMPFMAFAVKVEDAGAEWIIETDMYRVHWKVAAQAGYSKAFAEGNKNSLIGGGGGSRSFYHSANYAGWKDWGAAAKVEVVEEGGGKLVMSYEMDDGGSKIYHVTATYWDGVPYFKHEVVVEAKSKVVSFSDGHDPMWEPRNGQGAKNEYELWDQPFPHVAMANDDGYIALYTEVGTARKHAWQADGRMDLVHDNVGVNLKKGAKSDPLVYYIAVGKGDLTDADKLADSVTKEPSSVLSVSPKAKLTTTWGDLKR